MAQVDPRANDVSGELVAYMVALHHADLDAIEGMQAMVHAHTPEELVAAFVGLFVWIAGQPQARGRDQCLALYSDFGTRQMSI